MATRYARGVKAGSVGIFVLESEKTHDIEWNTNVYEIIRQKKFDRSLITFFGRKGIG